MCIRDRPRLDGGAGAMSQAYRDNALEDVRASGPVAASAPGRRIMIMPYMDTIDGARAAVSEHRYEPVSYTHLDVYKRQTET